MYAFFCEINLFLSDYCFWRKISVY